eukprot:2361259-Rhodomonas_salina.1
MCCTDEVSEKDHCLGGVQLTNLLRRFDKHNAGVAAADPNDNDSERERTDFEMLKQLPADEVLSFCYTINTISSADLETSLVYSQAALVLHSCYATSCTDVA